MALHACSDKVKTCQLIAEQKEQRLFHSQAVPQAQSGSGGSDVVGLTLEADGDAGADDPVTVAAAPGAEPGEAGADGLGAAAADRGGDTFEALVECSTTTPGIRLHKRAPAPLCCEHAERVSPSQYIFLCIAMRTCVCACGGHKRSCASRKAGSPRFEHGPKIRHVLDKSLIRTAFE